MWCVNSKLEQLHRLLSARPHIKQALGNVTWLIVDRIVRMSVGLFVGILLARSLGPSDFGLFSYATALVAIAATIANLGLDGVVVKDILQYPSRRNVIFGTAAVLQFLGGVITSLTLFCIVYVFRNENKVLILAVSIISPTNFIKSGADIVRNWYDSQLLSKITVRVENLNFVLFSIVKVLIIYSGFGIFSILTVVLIESILASTLLLIVCNFRDDILKHSKFSLKVARSLIRKSWPYIMSSIAVMIYIRIDSIMIESYLGSEVVGYYGVATRVGEVFYFLPGAIVGSVFPMIIAAKKVGYELYTSRFTYLLAILTWISILISSVISFFSHEIVDLLFGYKYLNAAPILAVVSWSTTFVFTGIATGRWFLLENMQVSLLHRTVVGALINIVLNFILIPIYGAVGAAFATLIAQSYVNLFSNLLNKKTRSLFSCQMKSFLYPIYIVRNSLYNKVA